MLEELIQHIQRAPLHTGRGGYTLTMRECQGAEGVIAELARDAATPARVPPRLHVGWGSFRNLDIVAARRSDWVLLLDVNVHQLRLWRIVLGSLEASVDSRAFIRRLAESLPSAPRPRQFSGDTGRWLSGDLERPGSWLFLPAPERFEHIRRLVSEGRITTGCMDLRGGGLAKTNAIEHLADRIRHLQASQRLTLDTLYVSNIPWMLRQPVGFFGETHVDFLPAGTGGTPELPDRNLAALTCLCRWVVSACRLRADACPGNLQWVTELKLCRGQPPSELRVEGFGSPL